MNIKKIESGGVWVKASEELPDYDVHTVTRNKITGEFSWFCYNNGDSFDEGEEWLKPIEQVYPLTGDDLREIIYMWESSTKDKTISEFIQSITTIK